MSEARQHALEVVRSTLGESDLTWKEISEGVFTVDLPGEKKLSTPCRLDVGEHAFGVHAFVARQPDENHERVYRWLLERNLRTYAVSYAVDHLSLIHI